MLYLVWFLYNDKFDVKLSIYYFPRSIFSMSITQNSTALPLAKKL